MPAKKAKRKKTGAIKVGIAGLGRSGWGIHAHHMEPLRGKYKIVAALDASPARRKEAEERFGCKTYTRYADMLKNDDIELVVIAMPNQLHARYSIDAMKAGKDVLCEKPLATNLRDADRMIACARKTRRILSPFQNRRYAKDFQAVRKVIDSGVLGRIVHIRMASHGFGRRWDWQTLKKNGGGTLNNTGPHPIDQALVLFGKKQPKVFCLRDKALTLGDADDHVKVVLHGTGSPTVEVEVTAASPYSQDSWLVMGTQGGLSGNSSQLKWKYFNPKKLAKRRVSEKPTPDRSYNREKLPLVEKEWAEEKDKSLGQKQFYLDLHATIRKGKALQVKPEEVRRQMQVLDQCRKQAPV